VGLEGQLRLGAGIDRVGQWMNDSCFVRGVSCCSRRHGRNNVHRAMLCKLHDCRAGADARLTLWSTTNQKPVVCCSRQARSPILSSDQIDSRSNTSASWVKTTEVGQTFGIHVYKIVMRKQNMNRSLFNFVRSCSMLFLLVLCCSTH
jgi:hypothetical protein